MWRRRCTPTRLSGAVNTAFIPRFLMPPCMCLPRWFCAADDEDGVLLPFVWSDVTLYGHGASELRVRLDLSPS